jgi:hypothetical protein
LNDDTPERRPGSRPKVSIGRLMVAVAVVAAFLPVLRGDPDGERVSGALIVATCVLLLAYKMASNSIAWNRSAGLAVTRWQMVWIGLGSLATALLIIGAADFLFLFFCMIIGSVFSDPHFSWRRIDLIGIILGALSTVLVVSGLRRAIRREWEAKSCPPPPDVLPDRVDPDHRP